ncbi:cyclin-dependent kinase 4 inhibitor B [Spinachia spinachia]
MHTATRPNPDEPRTGRTHGRTHARDKPTRSDRFPDGDAAGSLDMTLQDELTRAAATGDTADVKSLLRDGASVDGENRFGRTALQVMMMGSTPVAQVLLRHGADPNMRDRSTGATPLHDAARTGFLDTVRLLVQFRADPRARDHRTCEPVDLARENNHVDVVDFLQSLSNSQARNDIRLETGPEEACGLNDANTVLL